jgi:hypothetical protein
MEPSKKAQPIEKFLEILGGRSTAIKDDKCISEPIGCGREVSDMVQWSEIQLKEYRISGLCNICQNRIFGNDE